MTTHTFDLGEIVTIFNCTLGGKFIIEGTAAIAGFVSDVDEQYFVRFRGEKGIHQRFVDPSGQVDPEAHLRMLNREAASLGISPRRPGQWNEARGTLT